MSDVTFAGRRFAVTRFTNIIDDCWSMEYAELGGDLEIAVSRSFEAPDGQLEVWASAELPPDLAAAVLADARSWLPDSD
ncbi:hypothetical protein [Streptomyces chilikensis]|uniref:hypothetical protein n=1 Tax=Streptomyces chilikensis TaxID=1194079 RepID=UPI001409F08D|nr:hypothetical protein [Streptomyces chilikensis]